jgi:hypothetical protein
VLARRRDAARGEARGERAADPGHAPRPRAERTPLGAHDGPAARHVEHRGQVHVHPHAAQAPRGVAPGAKGEPSAVRVAHPGRGAVGRPVETLHAPALLVEHDEQRRRAVRAGVLEVAHQAAKLAA